MTQWLWQAVKQWFWQADVMQWAVRDKLSRVLGRGCDAVGC